MQVVYISSSVLSVDPRLELSGLTISGIVKRGQGAQTALPVILDPAIPANIASGFMPETRRLMCSAVPEWVASLTHAPAGTAGATEASTGVSTGAGGADGSMSLAVTRCEAGDAVALAGRLGAEVVALVGTGGSFQCPRQAVPEARELEELSFEEAAELSRFDHVGLEASVVAPMARLRVAGRLVPVAVGGIRAATDLPRAEALPPRGPGDAPASAAKAYDEATAPRGTAIGPEPAHDGGPVRAVAVQKDVVMLSVSGACLPGTVGVAARLFATVGASGVSVLLITQASSEYSISLCVRTDDADAAVAAINREFSAEMMAGSLDPVDVIRDLAILTPVGDGMRRRKGIAGRFFTQLSRADVNVVAIAQGSSERSISAVVEAARVDRGLRMVYQSFFDSSMPIDLVVIGVGTVGSALLGQVATQSERLEDHGVAVRLVAIANSRRMVIASCGVTGDGLDPADWRTELDRDGQPMSIDALVALGAEFANPVLVDCTASDAIPSVYPLFMLAGFHIVTPNKRGNTGTMARYLALRNTARDHRRRYLYETTVGAGLPVIENLQNLLHAGDRLESFSGILSGSLSFLFGRLEDGLSFSEAVREAMARGFTEPDPRDDLGGVDVARKVLILAREAGLSMELSDVALDGLLPPEYGAMGRDEFLSSMPRLDAHIAGLVTRAKAQGKVLRFVGSIHDGKGSVGLAMVGPENPLFSVRGGENALAFTTRYYSPVPLLLRGYGAGAQVTSAGIFADILRTLNWIREA